MKPLLVSVALAALAAPAAVLAQGQPIRLTAGFQPDPATVAVTAGGARDTSSMQDAMRGCFAGFIPDRPQAVISYSGSGRPLNVSVQAEADTTLAVRTPDGRWLCNDDGEQGLNPEVLIAQPATGDYQVFVGRFGLANATAPATLRLSATLRAERRAGEQARTDDMEAMPAMPMGVRRMPNVNAAPGRTVSLTGGFRPDPTVVSVQAGGDRASEAIGADCSAGLLPNRPTVRLNYRAGRGPLTLSVNSEADTTLAVRGPNGRWTCSDDSPLGLDPQISFARPASGRYDLFVGRFGVQDQMAPARLTVSNRPPVREEPMRPVAPDRRPNPRLPATARTLSLNSGFRPDPVSINVRAGGDRSPTSLGEGCHGVVSAAPTVRLTYRAGRLPLSFGVTSAADTTLLVRGPDGRWTCNDDFDALNPRITFAQPRSGRYDVWVGRFNTTERNAASLSITEAPPPAPVEDLGEAEGPVLGADTLPTPDAPVAAEASLRSGFLPDPYTVQVRAGGDRNGGRAGQMCNGVISAAPQFRLNWGGGRAPLTFAARSEADTTLVVRGPGGVWNCNDDTDGLDPRVTFDDARAGRYDVYVGRFNSLERVPATLSVTERPQAPGTPMGE